MCGRYYVDDDTAREIEKLIRQIDEKRTRGFGSSAGRIEAGDICPGKEAPVLSGKEGLLCFEWQHWGFPGFQGKKLIFNARCESALEKPMFREGILHRRAVIPAAGFYEWDHDRRKHIFYRDGEPVMYLAGCYRKYGDGDRFVILTTQANASMEPVHERMPLILERKAEDGQMSLFDL